MGVCIPGAKKPDNCDECFIRQSNLAYCQLTRRSTSHYPSGKEIKGIPNYCPLVEIKEPHGRLIDADALSEKCGDWYTEEGTEAGFIGTLKSLLDEQSTVIEAEGE